VESGEFRVQRSEGRGRGDHNVAAGHRRPTGRISADFVFRKARVAVFVDGCFWHACPKHSNVPASNRAFWKKKLAGNRFRDRLVNRVLRRMGWGVVRIWEHEIARSPERVIERVRQAQV